MAEKTDLAFHGFPKATVAFFRQLAANNSKDWFALHKSEYETEVLAPAQDFVSAMGERLRKISPNVNADPRVDKSIFRLYRDIRFSPDKSPFKTHLGIFFWEGPLKKMECSGYYFHLEPPKLMLAAGMHIFTKPALDEFRRSVVDDKHGAALARAIKSVEKKGPYEVGGRFYKKTPRGFAEDHPNADLLLFNALYAAVETTIPKELHSQALVDYSFKCFAEMAPLHNWLVEMTGRQK